MPDINAITSLFKFGLVAIFLALGYYQGRRNEKRHLAELQQRENAFKDVLVFATRYPAPSAKPQDPVLVSGSVVVASDYFRMFVAGLRKILGGQFSAYEMLTSRARREAILKMKEQARNAGCNMIFNVRIQTARIAGGSRGSNYAAVEVLAYGTAFAPGQGSVADSPHHYRPGPPLKDYEGLHPEGFDLTKNPATRSVMWGLGLATIFAFAELLGLQDYNYVDGAPMLGLSCIAVLGIIFLRRLFQAHAVPLAESIALCVLSGLAIIAAAYFVALRINALTDITPLRPSVYVLQQDGSLHPKESGLPILHFDAQDYWHDQPIGSEHKFTLRMGMFGFWQYNGVEYRQQIREYYRQQRTKSRGKR